MSGRMLVTGAAGFIGAHVTRSLLDLGHEVTGVDAFTPYYDPARKRANVAGLLGRPGFTMVDGDLTTLRLDRLTRLLAGAAAVVHEAGQPGVSASWGRSFPAYLRHNVLATQRLLEACVRAGVPRLVLASSSSVYGDAPTYPTTESAATAPVSPYGVTKLAAEQLCLAYTRVPLATLSVVALRYFTVYGPGQRPDMAFSRFIAAARAGLPITVYGDGEQRRDVTHVADAVRATVAAIGLAEANTVINVGGGRPVTVNQVLELVGRITGRPLEVVHVPARPGDARHTGADGTRAEALLDWRARVDLATGLADQAAWMATSDRDLAGPVGADLG
jgi:nucleoside-diphosphate-sugar epimerase